MGKPVSREQALQLVSVIANNLDWGALNSEVVQRLIEHPMQIGVDLDWFLERLCAGKKVIELTPTTFGPEIQPPFKDAVLVEDGPGDDSLDISELKELLPILNEGEEIISFQEAVSRSKDWGQRAAFALRDARNAGKISKEVWPVGTYIVCGKTVWRRPDGRYYGWYVYRIEVGFYCDYVWFDDKVDSDGRRLPPRK